MSPGPDPNLSRCYQASGGHRMLFTLCHWLPSFLDLRKKQTGSRRKGNEASDDPDYVTQASPQVGLSSLNTTSVSHSGNFNFWKGDKQSICSHLSCSVGSFGKRPEHISSESTYLSFLRCVTILTPTISFKVIDVCGVTLESSV